MQEIKLNNAEKRKRWEWERIQARLFALFVFAVNIKNGFPVRCNLAKALVLVVGQLNDGFLLVFEYLVEQINEQFFVGNSRLKPKSVKGLTYRSFKGTSNNFILSKS